MRLRGTGLCQLQKLRLGIKSMHRIVSGARLLTEQCGMSQFTFGSLFIGYNYQRMSPIDALGVPGPQDPGRFSWVIRGRSIPDLSAVVDFAAGRMGGAKRYPSIAVREHDGFRKELDPILRAVVTWQ